VTTSFAHFNTPEHRDDADLSKFHTIEDQGIPRALASVVGAGAPLLRSLSKGRRKPLWIVWTITRYARKRLGEYVRAPFRNRDERQLQLASEDEQVMNMMCIAAMGRERSTGRLRLGRGWRDTTLRAERRNDGGEPERFEDDPIYDEIRASLGRFAEALRPEGDKAEFENPFLTGLGQLFGGRSIALTHPLGGCRMGHSPEYGVVDEFGRVFDKRADDGKSVHRGLYIADASIIPTALAVNPSLTISALALRTADTVIDDLGAAAKPTNAATAHGGR
jgi:choline dehydrogenase-like flavoprotein